MRQHRSTLTADIVNLSAMLAAFNVTLFWIDLLDQQAARSGC
jgi:hypothetical protein